MTNDTHKVLDFSQDVSGADRHRLTMLYAQPEYVKQASHEELCGDTEALPQHLFAVPTRRLYRCHTKAATWLSALYFGDKGEAIPEPHRSAARAHILKSAGAFGIIGDVSELWQKMSAALADITAATPDEDFAYVWVGENGTKERRYPVRNAHEVKAASAWFAKHRDKFEYDARRTFANKLLDKADIYGAALPEAEMLAKVAGWGTCAAATLAEAWEKRAALTQTSFPAYAKAAMDTVGVIKKSPADSRQAPVLEKMARLLDQFDRQTKLVTLYDKGLERPEEALFQVTVKAADDFRASHVQLVTGNVYEKHALADIPLQTVRGWLGDEIADAVGAGGNNKVDIEKMAEVLAVLPRPDAVTFDRMAASLQLTPAVIDKAAAAEILTPEDLAGLRQVYLDAKKALQAQAG